MGVEEGEVGRDFGKQNGSIWVQEKIEEDEDAMKWIDDELITMRDTALGYLKEHQ